MTTYSVTLVDVRRAKEPIYWADILSDPPGRPTESFGPETPFGLLVIIPDKTEYKDGPTDFCFLYNIGPDFRFSGDTWHLTKEDAKHQATVNYGDAIVGWIDFESSLTPIFDFLFAMYFSSWKRVYRPSRDTDR